MARQILRFRFQGGQVLKTDVFETCMGRTIDSQNLLIMCYTNTRSLRTKTSELSLMVNDYSIFPISSKLGVEKRHVEEHREWS